MGKGESFGGKVRGTPNVSAKLEDMLQSGFGKCN